MTSLTAACLLLVLQPGEEVGSRVSELVKILGSSGQKPGPSEMKRLAGLDRVMVQAQFTADSLSECLAALTRPGDSGAVNKLSQIRSQMSPLFDLAVDGSSTAAQIRESMRRYAASEASLLKLASDSTQAVALERQKLSRRPGSGLRKSISLVLVTSLPKSSGISLSAHGVPMEPGLMMRFPNQESVALIASPWDPRTVRRSQFEPTPNVEVLPSTYESKGRVLEYASLDRKNISRWEMTGESYRWAAAFSPKGSAVFSQKDLPQDNSYTIVGRFGMFTAAAAQSQVDVSITGKVQWTIATTRNGKKSSVNESHDVKQAFRLVLFAL